MPWKFNDGHGWCFISRHDIVFLLRSHRLQRLDRGLRADHPLVGGQATGRIRALTEDKERRIGTGMKTFIIFCCNPRCADRLFHRLADIVRDIATIRIKHWHISDDNTEVLFVTDNSGSGIHIERARRGRDIVDEIPCGRIPA